MTRKAPVPDKEELITAYQTQGETISSLSKKYGVSNPTIRKWLKAYNIPLKSHQQACEETTTKKKSALPDKETFQKLYEMNSIKGLEGIYHVGQSTIYQWIEEFGIEKKSLVTACKDAKQRQFDRIQFDKQYLETVYAENKNLGVVADKLNISYSHTRQLFRKYSIETEKPWRSKGETDLFDFCVETSPEDEWISNDKSIINPFELDIVNNTKKIAIEYCGLYWHSQGYGEKSPSYHSNKYDKCLSSGYKLYTIFESDSTEKVKRLLKSVLGQNEKIHARKTTVDFIDSKTANEFNREHHLSESTGAKIHSGLFHDKELVMVLSMGKPRFKSKSEWECVRMTTHSNYSVVGGASKLFSHFTKHHKGSIITFADKRFGDGKVYLNCGFERLQDTKSNYWYFHKDNPYNTYSRVKFQKHKLEKLLDIFDPDLSEYQNMLLNKYDRIWDCGNAVYFRQ